jgi:hypothetical protein
VPKSDVHALAIEADTAPMTNRYSRVLSAISLFIPSVCIFFCIFLAVVSFKDRYVPGHGYGFFMLLMVVTPAILFALLVSSLLRLVVPEQKQKIFLSICVLALLALTWNWFFLYFFLR